jgi:hypothetical protein
MRLNSFAVNPFLTVTIPFSTVSFWSISSELQGVSGACSVDKTPFGVSALRY